MRRALSVFVAAAVGAAIASGAAFAVPKVAPGHDAFEMDCVGLGSVTLSIPRSDNNSAAQIVGEHAHLVPTAFGFLIENVTQNTVIVSDSFEVGGGHAHPNKETTTCEAIVLESPAAQLPPDFGPLPPTTLPTDVIRVTVSATVIVKG